MDTLPIPTRVGLIVDGDSRFLGRSIFDWERDFKADSDAAWRALGVTDLSPNNREAIRVLCLCLMSPDARVWPLKLTRLLASWGDPVAGHFGGQLVTAGRVMGPGVVRHAASFLEGIDHIVGASPSDSVVSAAVGAWRQAHPGPVAGFGVPFRRVDERRAALLKFVGDGPLSRGRFFRLHLQVEAALAAVTPNLSPNIGLSAAALLLDIGIAVERCGLAVNVLMAPIFLAHAIEAAATDGALNSLPISLIQYQGAAARSTLERESAVPPPALRRTLGSP